ncbi:serine O-acetyltransferase [Methylocystis bryophila]|uniref:Serine acetyltransferase n=1 Tax=Methylocystis bryophila TaxID=655015 RepID=A0A1W6N0Z6_9HYPH|nr:serine O-acetyltransferase [Methylocystis bryophila]ARN83489.1 serine O-acetyltransferase [Methylocystis bryophila]
MSGLTQERAHVSGKAETANAASRPRPILEDLACVSTRDPAARGKFETLLTYPGVHAVIWHRLANWLWSHEWRFLARLTSWLCRFLTNIDIHPGASIGRRFFIDHGAGVVIGETAVVGDDVTIYHGVTLGGVSWSPGRRHPMLEDGVIVGAGAKILGPITVGRNARVGANSVVIESVPRDATVVGIPAKTVQRDAARYAFGGRINLNHHLIPDPVGEAFAALADRVEFLEARLSHLQNKVKGRVDSLPAQSAAAGASEPPRII